MKNQTRLVDVRPIPRRYHDILTTSVNGKGVIDVDTVKGCTLGMRAHPDGGCYGECYANKIASRRGIAFGVSVSRHFADGIGWHRDAIIRQLMGHPVSWYRVGVMGDPCHDWDHTLSVIRRLRPAQKAAVIVTKHWIPFSADHISQMLELDVVVHTSTSGLDTDAETRHRVRQFERLRDAGILSVNRIVTCDYGDSEWARNRAERQRYLLTFRPIIDTPLRVSPSNPHVLNGDIRTVHRPDSIGGGSLVSMHDSSIFLGSCNQCPDQCGVLDKTERWREDMPGATLPLFETSKGIAAETSEIQFRYVESVLGSGFEESVAELALQDGIAHRAARKNMQKHSAIILLIGGEFAGFFTFQNNSEHGEFCLLQSVIRPDVYSPELYRAMVAEVLDCNTEGLPALITTNPKSKFETPAVFQEFGFRTYLAMSGFEYMLAGAPAYHRMKVLAHITMTNVWNSTRGEWIKLKKEWNGHIARAGEREGIPNPTFATREGSWQGEAGFANVVTGRSHNGNASVLDPVACEVILRFFTPTQGNRVYNPFGGGVQFGFVAGASGYEYEASEIRQNQCDANNALCSEWSGVRWVQADSSVYDPEGMFDLVFACPPYYRVERYVDYDGDPPDGEINALKTYDQFRDALFAGYRRSIAHLSQNRFFVVMIGDSRDAKGAYHGHEAETELFLKQEGLHLYNKIVYLEAEFTRLAQAKKTLHLRKFPKREQKVIVAYKGDLRSIADEFASIGRL